MKRITEERAKKLISCGKYPKCKVSRDVYEPVTSLEKLESLKRLSTVQNFELYEDTSLITLPENAMPISIDDAIKLVSDNESICCVRNGEVETINATSKLMGVIRSCNIRGDQFVLYWLVT